jgi:hypothetical protein
MIWLSGPQGCCKRTTGSLLCPIVLIRRDQHRVSKSAAEKLLEDLGRQLSTLDRAKVKLIETRLTARIEACRKAGMILTEAALQAIAAQLLEELQRKRTISAGARKRLLAGTSLGACRTGEQRAEPRRFGKPSAWVPCALCGGRPPRSRSTIAGIPLLPKSQF